MSKTHNYVVIDMDKFEELCENSINTFDVAPYYSPLAKSVFENGIRTSKHLIEKATVARKGSTIK